MENNLKYHQKNRLFFPEGDLTPLYTFINEKTALPSKQLLKVVFQYTSWEALFNGIIRQDSCGNPEICLRATNCQYLNDPGEIQYGLDIASKIIVPHFKDISQEELYHLPLDNVYIISFSSVINGLPMWKMYGHDGEGVALGFDIDLLQRKESKLFQCIYDDGAFRANIQDVMRQCLISPRKGENELAVFRKYLILLQKLVKHVAYRHEEEYRLVTITDDVPLFRTDHNKLIPFIENHFPIESLKVIWLGPRCNPKQASFSLIQWLDSVGLKDVQIIISDLPYR